MTFDDFGEELREFLRTNTRPEVQVTYFAYKAGMVRSYPTLEAAHDYSSLVERVVDRGPVLAWEQTREDLSKKQIASWKAWLRTEFPDLSDRQFERLYDKADGLCTSYAAMDTLMGEWYRVFYG